MPQKSYSSFLIAAYFVIGYGCLVYQASLGTPLYMLLAFGAMLPMVLVPRVRDALYVSDIIFIVFLLYSVFFTLVLKSWFGQSLDTNLFAPEMSMTFLFLGTTAATIGYFAASVLTTRKVSKQTFSDYFNPAIYMRLAVPLFMLGLVFVFLHQLLGSRITAVGEGGGFGGFGIFNFLVHVGFVIQIKRFADMPGNVRERGILIGMVAVLVLLAMLTNTKIVLFLALLELGLAAMLFRGFRIGLGATIGGLIFIGVLVLEIAPAIQVARGEMENVSMFGRVAVTWDVMQRNDFSPTEMFAQIDTAVANRAYNSRTNYLFPETAPVERFAMIMPIDQIARAMDGTPVMGMAPIFNDLQAMIPSAFVVKSGATSPDLIAWHYGWLANGIIGRRVIGLVGSSVASFGWLGLFACAVMMFFSTSMLDLIWGRVRDRPLALFGTIHALVLAEKEIGQYLVYMMYNIPIIFTTLFLIFTAYRLVFGEPAGSRRRPRQRLA